MMGADGDLTSIAKAAVMPAAARRVSICAARKALMTDASLSLNFGVRRKAVWKRTRPRRQARVTTQLSANHTCRPAIASRQVHRVLSFIAHTARRGPVAR